MIYVIIIHVIIIRSGSLRFRSRRNNLLFTFDIRPDLLKTYTRRDRRWKLSNIYCMKIQIGLDEMLLNLK